MSGYVNLASCGDVVKLWCVKSVQKAEKRFTHEFNLEKNLSFHSKPVNCVRWNHNNQVLASCGDDGKLFLCHSKTGTQLGTLPLEGSEDHPITCCDFSSKSRYLCLSHARSLSVWDLKVKQKVFFAEDVHLGTSTCACFSPDDSLMASCCTGGVVLLHNSVENRLISRLCPSLKPLTCTAFSGVDSLLAACGHGDVTAVWDLNRATTDSPPAFTLKGHDSSSSVSCLKFLDGKSLIATGGEDRLILLHDVRSSKAVQSILCSDPITCMSLVTSMSAAVGMASGQVALYDFRAARAIRIKEAHIGAVRSIAFHNSRRAAAPKPKPVAEVTPVILEPFPQRKTDHVVENAVRKAVGSPPPRPKPVAAPAEPRADLLPVRPVLEVETPEKPLREAYEAIVTPERVSYQSVVADLLKKRTLDEEEEEEEKAHTPPPPRPAFPAAKDLQKELLMGAVEEVVSKYHDATHQDIQNLHLELLRQNHLQLRSISAMLAEFVKQNRELVEENALLKQQLERMRAMQ